MFETTNSNKSILDWIGLNWEIQKPIKIRSVGILQKKKKKILNLNIKTTMLRASLMQL